MNNTEKAMVGKSILKMNQMFIDNMMSSQELKKLKADDIRVVMNVASGAVSHISKKDRIRAIKVTSIVGGNEGCKAIGSIINNENEDSGMRSIAAMNLSFQQSEDAERELINSLKVSDDAVLARVIKSLGHIGGKHTIEALEKIKDTKTLFVKKQLVFTKELISCRLKTKHKYMKFVMGNKRSLEKEKDVVKIKFDEINGAELNKYLHSLVGSRYQIELSKGIGYKAECLGMINHIIFINKAHEKNMLSSIRREKAILGLLARYSEGVSAYIVQSVILTSPYDSVSIEVMICRNNGDILYSGLGNIKNDIMTFSLADIEQPGGVERQFLGKMTNEKIVFEKCFSQRKRKNQLHPISID